MSLSDRDLPVRPLGGSEGRRSSESRTESGGGGARPLEERPQWRVQLRALAQIVGTGGG